MSDVTSTSIARLFAEPGRAGSSTRGLLNEAARAHARLLVSASSNHHHPGGCALGALIDFIQGPAEEQSKRRLLDHPMLIEALHRLAAGCPDLDRWDRAVAARDQAIEPAEAIDIGRAMLGNVALPLLLRNSSAWCGELELCTDTTARLQFPFCDWSIALRAETDLDQDAVFRRTLRVTLDGERALWRLRDTDDPPLLVMSRCACLRMLVDNDPQLDLCDMDFPHPAIRPRLHCATRLGNSGILYDAAVFEDFSSHAGITGAIVQALLEAIRQNAPGIYRELCAYIATIRGFELPPAETGQIGSFSTPVSPGVIGFNVPYTAQHEPRLDPFCFSWLGHELGHTKHYLIDDVAYSRGWVFLINPGDATDTIPRYARPFPVRTLFQMPYVHLYELCLLMDFVDAHFRGLPWQISGDSIAFGEDLIAEIREAFELIGQYARLTATGETVLAHFRNLLVLALRRWRGIAHRN